MNDPPQDFRFTLNAPVRRNGRPARRSGSPVVAGVLLFLRPLRWFQLRLWRLKWLESTIILFAITAFSMSDHPELVGFGQIIGMLIVSPLAALMFMAMLKAFVFVIIISGTPLVSILLRQCVYYHDRFLAAFCEEPITFGKGY